MEVMTSANFSRAGAIDLSTLAASSGAPGGSSGGTGASYVMDVAEADFESLAQHSASYPVVLEITLPSAPETRGVDDVLVKLTNAAGGRWLLARVDAQAAPRIAQALGVQAVPTVLALIGGQVAPLFQGTRDEPEIKQILDEVVKVALANGLTGRAKPVANAEAEAEDGEQAPDPRFAAADEKLANGDYQGAAEEFEKLLRANPRDTEALAGKAQSELLARSLDADAPAVIEAANAAPDDIKAQLAAADIEMLAGVHPQAFERLIELIRSLPAGEREPVRLRLLDLFATIDPADAELLKARRALSSALF